MVLSMLVGAFIAFPAQPASAATNPSAASGAIYAWARTGGGSLNVRSSSSASAALVRTLADGALLSVDCQVTGQSIKGNVRTTNKWNRLSAGGYVSDAYVSRDAELGTCAENPPPPSGSGGTPVTSPTGAIFAWIRSGGTPLNVRSGASVDSTRVTTLEDGTTLSVDCQVTGQSVSGRIRTSNKWNRLSAGGYVSDSYVVRGANLRDCGSDTPGKNPTPTPRNGNGSWPAEGCTAPDPTTGNCITPRTLYALNQAMNAGFNRYVSCYRSLEDGGEHPRGRACDFSVSPAGFDNVTAQGGNREYGDALAAWLIANSSRLGVYYVIWYKRIWMAGSGWETYTPCCGPATEHTNHVHLSVY